MCRRRAEGGRSQSFGFHARVACASSQWRVAIGLPPQAFIHRVLTTDTSFASGASKIKTLQAFELPESRMEAQNRQQPSREPSAEAVPSGSETPPSPSPPPGPPITSAGIGSTAIARAVGVKVPAAAGKVARLQGLQRGQIVTHPISPVLLAAPTSSSLLVNSLHQMGNPQQARAVAI